MPFSSVEPSSCIAIISFFQVQYLAFSVSSVLWHLRITLSDLRHIVSTLSHTGLGYLKWHSDDQIGSDAPINSTTFYVIITGHGADGWL